jgi:hypothetical protein
MLDVLGIYESTQLVRSFACLELRLDLKADFVHGTKGIPPA